MIKPVNETLQTPPPLATPSAGLDEQLLVSGSDIFALGHYPGNPIYPGVLILERLSTLARRLAEREFGGPAAVTAVKRVQYLDAVVPGDVVTLCSSIKKRSDTGFEVSVSAVVGDKTKTRATLLCTPGNRPLATASTAPDAGDGAPVLTHRDLGRVLPHRYPFLLLDNVQAYESGQWIRARKVLNRASPLFLDQQPTSYPQGLAIESFGQAGIALFFLSRPGEQPVDIVLGSVGETELLGDIPFDAVLTVEARIERLLPNAVVFSGLARVGDQVVTRVGSLVAMVDPR